MNGFKATADSYREMAAKGECTQEQASRCGFVAGSETLCVS